MLSVAPHAASAVVAAVVTAVANAVAAAVVVAAACLPPLGVSHPCSTQIPDDMSHLEISPQYHERVQQLSGCLHYWPV